MEALSVVNCLAATEAVGSTESAAADCKTAVSNRTQDESYKWGQVCKVHMWSDRI
jgi:hypothetical protein